MKKQDKPQPRQGEGAFIQFTPAQRPSSCNLRGVSITFPDGVNLTLQESSVESVISLLSLYISYVDAETFTIKGLVSRNPNKKM